MIDPDRQRQRDHWQAIAEQLGLSSEPDGDSAADEPAEARQVEARNEPGSSELPEQPVEPSEPVPQTALVSKLRGSRSEADNLEAATSEDAEAGAPKHGGGPSKDSQLEEEQSGRKRGRRDRSSKRDRPADSEQDATSFPKSASEDGAREEGKSERRRRGTRGRGRSKNGREPEAAAATAPPLAGTTALPVREAEDDDDEDMRSLSSWNVPSWNELIASLYRPER